jgi:hypothetical protein
MSDEPYVFKERPAAKSSTSVIMSHADGGVACQLCGCRPTALVKNHATEKKGCTCRCHKEEESDGGS